MPDTVPLIDLDAPPPPEPPVARFPRPRLRPVLVGGFLAAALLSLTASAPQRGELREVLAAGTDAAAAYKLSSDALFTATFGRNPSVEAGIHRYALSDGSQGAGTELWATTVPQLVQVLTLDDTGTLLLARSASDPRITLLDAATGTILWRVTGANTSVVTTAAGKVLLRTELTQTTAELRLADGRTGTTIWRRSIDALSDPHDFRAAGRIVVLGLDGHVTTLRFADGSVLGEGDLGVRRKPDTTDVIVDAAGERVYVTETGALTAYRLPGLVLEWQARKIPYGAVTTCGPMLCVAGNNEVSGLDPADGSVRWTAPGWSGVSPLADGTVVLNRPTPVINAGVGSGIDDHERRVVRPPEYAAIDARTGRVLRLLAEVDWTAQGLQLRADLRIAGKTWVQLLDSDGVPHTVGSLDTARSYGCQVALPYLACPTVTGPTTVWHLPLP
ncbi:outer membrane protein assembly factor BamB family protein [Winogradskya consettensis]|uniref:outer membrane protein assembly factor BamB family protein n=1 Tax=Winogradskya consettensis TaxID=113560 RepID=UPI001BB3D999|nr:PQQ-binding-like beta-propeller repeat protein [Actinoplanes consettensis]